MKKICIVTTVSLTMKSFVVETAKHLYNECGYDITLICNDDKAFADSLPEYIKFTPVSMARGVDLSVFSSILQFVKIFKREKFDLVQFSTPNASLAASIAAKICKVPVRLYCQWGIRYVGFSGVARKIFKFLEKIVCVNATAVNSVSPLNKAFAVSEGLYKDNKAKVVGRGGTIGVDLTKYDILKKEEWRKEVREENGLTENDFVFGFSGRVSTDKGSNELFSAFKKLSEENDSVKLFIAGPIDDGKGLDENIFNWAKNSDKVVFTGQLDNSLMCKQYAAMDVLVHPTYREGFGMVIQEASALACPVITTDIPGASEVLEDGKSCLLVKPADEKSLYKKMKELCSDKEKASRMGQDARAFTEKYYERSIMLNNQLKRYKELLEIEGSKKMKTVLTDKDLSGYSFGEDIQVKKININTMSEYNGDETVVAIAGSRAMAIKAVEMALPSLKFFQLTSAGFDGVPLEKYAEKGVAVANAGSVYSVPIAETVVFGILQMAKKIRKNPNNRRFNILRGYDSFITELDEKKVLIMGAGNIGTAVADRLLGFGVEIDGYDPYCQEKPQYRKTIRTREDLKNELPKYDYIVSTLPDNEDTKKFINKEFFDCMKNTAVIVNVGRKAVFDNEAFYAALKTKKIGGAVLDMFEKVPNPVTNKFRRLKNVVILPGVAAISKEVNPRLKAHMAKNIEALINGKKIGNVINGVN